MITAPNATGATATNDRPCQDQTTDTETLVDLDSERKAFAVEVAELALAGLTLHQLAHGGYLVSRCDRTFHSNDLAGVRGFAQRVGVAL